MAMGGHVGREGSPARTRVAEDEAGDDYDLRHAPKRGETMVAVSPQQVLLVHDHLQNKLPSP